MSDVTLGFQNFDFPRFRYTSSRLPPGHSLSAKGIQKPRMAIPELHPCALDVGTRLGTHFYMFMPLDMFMPHRSFFDNEPIERCQ